jgi:hypothetical protein
MAYWMIVCSVYLYIATLGVNVRICRISGASTLQSEAWCPVSSELRHSRQSESSSVSSHRNEAPAPLTWWDNVGALQTCLMIGETTDGANCLTYLRHRR